MKAISVRQTNIKIRGKSVEVFQRLCHLVRRAGTPNISFSLFMIDIDNDCDDVADVQTSESQKQNFRDLVMRVGMTVTSQSETSV